MSAAADFQRHYLKRENTWPIDLQDRATRVLLSLRMIELNKTNPAAVAVAKRLAEPDIETFATAYMEWSLGVSC